MLRKAIFCGLILFAASAQAQQAPSPKPSPASAPQLGSREYTQAAVRKVLDASYNYRHVCAGNNPKLEDMEKAYKAVGDMDFELTRAFLAEYDNIPELREQSQLTERLWRVASDLRKSKNPDFDAERKASDAYMQAQDKLDHMQMEYGGKLLKSVDPDDKLRNAAKRCFEHDEMLQAREDAEKKRKEQQLAEMRREMDAAAKDVSAKMGAPVKKTDDCNKGGGLPGPLEKLACQEGK